MQNLTSPRLKQIRYLLVGGSMAGLFSLLVWVFHGLGLYSWAASLLASASVAGPTFILHRRFTFGTTGPLWGPFIGFLSTIAMNVPFGAITVYFLVDVLGIHPFVSGLVATVVASLFNYIILSRFVFGSSQSDGRSQVEVESSRQQS